MKIADDIGYDRSQDVGDQRHHEEHQEYQADHVASALHKGILDPLLCSCDFGRKFEFSGFPARQRG